MSPAYTTEILPAQDPAQFEAAVQRAVALLRNGKLVALPTETVYGLAANAFAPDAVRRLYEVKGRPAVNPIICHVAGEALARRCVSAWPSMADKLARAFWPGPLTLVLPRSAAIPDIVTGGGHTVGIRWPAHPFMQAVIRSCDFPLAAPSANLSTRISPTTAEHVYAQLAGRIPLIVDGGPSHVGIESTVVDITEPVPRVLRPGMIHEEALLALTGHLASGASAGILRSPGLQKKHYAPRTKLAIFKWRDEQDLLALLAKAGVRASESCIIAHTAIPGSAGFLRIAVMPREPDAYARTLYAELHECDGLAARAIIVEALPDSPGWRALADRLTRAAA